MRFVKKKDWEKQFFSLQSFFFTNNFDIILKRKNERGRWQELTVELSYHGITLWTNDWNDDYRTRPFIKKNRRKNARSGSIERAANETGYIKSMALNEPFRDNGQLPDWCGESGEIGISFTALRSLKWRDKSRKDTVAKYSTYESRSAIQDYYTCLEKYPVYKRAIQCCDLITVEMEGLYLWIVHFINERDNARWSHWISNVLILNHLPRLFHNSIRKPRGCKKYLNCEIFKFRLLSDKVFRLTIKIMCMKKCLQKELIFLL